MTVATVINKRQKKRMHTTTTTTTPGNKNKDDVERDNPANHHTNKANVNETTVD